MPDFKPKYYSENFCSRNYVKVTECASCEARALYEDAHPAKPCRNCGSKPQERVGKWVIEKTTGFLWWKKILTKGYWKLKEE